jgi:hypothetical protein
MIPYNGASNRTYRVLEICVAMEAPNQTTLLYAVIILHS